MDPLQLVNPVFPDYPPVVGTRQPAYPHPGQDWGRPQYSLGNILPPALLDFEDNYAAFASPYIVPPVPHRLISPDSIPPTYQVDEQHLWQQARIDVTAPVTVGNLAGPRIGDYLSESPLATSHSSFTPNQQLPSFLGPRQSVFPPTWDPFSTSPLPSEDHTMHPTPPLPTRRPTCKIEMPRVVDPMSPGQILAYITLLSGGKCACAWEDSSGGTCEFRSSVDGVKRHVRTVHFGVKHFTCRFCERRFYGGYAHKLHLNSHTGHKPYKCGKCEQWFTSPSSRSNHRKRFHPRDDLPAPVAVAGAMSIP